MVHAKELYEAQKSAAEAFLGESMTPWEDLPWEARDRWQQHADELNEARLTNELP